jgi:ParB family chromosome partitioning protein
MREIGTLRTRGYSTGEIAAKTDFSEEYINAICYLLDHGEERLLAGIERGVIPTSVAMEIARAKDTEIQEALAEAYEKKALPGNQVLAIRRIIELRGVLGKSMAHGTRSPKPRSGSPRTRCARVSQGDGSTEAAREESVGEPEPNAVRGQRTAPPIRR